MEFSQILLLLLVIGEIVIIVIALIVYRMFKQYLGKIYQILWNLVSEDVSNKDIVTYLNEILNTLDNIRNSIKIFKEGKDLSILSSSSLKQLKDLTTEEEKDAIIELDLNDPSVRQWYEYLKKHAEEIKKRKLGRTQHDSQ